MTRRSVAGAAAALMLSGCGLVGGDDEASADAETALEGQRADVREAAGQVGRALVDRFAGHVLDSHGDWEGCESAFLDEFRNFRYLATVRIAGGADEPARALADLVGEAGFEPDDVGPDGLSASTAALVLSLRRVPGGGSSGDWLLQVTGAECVDVPEGEREEWLRREEPSPSVM